MKAERAVKRITFDRSKESPGKTLYVSVPKLNENEVLVPGSLALLFEIDLTGGHANNFLLQNVTRALVDKVVVKYGAPSCRTRWGTTSSRSGRTFSSRRRRRPRESKARTSARSAQALGPKNHGCRRGKQAGNYF